MYKDRKKLYTRLSKARGSKVLTYVTGDRPGLATQIASDAVDLFGDVLDHYEGAEKISLLLYTRGGETLAAWSIVNLIREFCDELEIIIPSKCHSAGTLMCLGADRLVMTKQASLGAIDPSVNSPLNPQIPGGQPNQRCSISVEDVAGFFEMAKTEAGIKEEPSLSQIYLKLSEHVHPVALGRVSRARSQIQDLAKKLLRSHMKDTKQISQITKTLCVEVGSHDYTIRRSEARESLKLNIETPSMELYRLIRDIYHDFRSELELTSPYRRTFGLKVDEERDYNLTTSLIETQRNGGYRHVKRGTLKMYSGPNKAPVVEDTIEFEGWEPLK